MRKLGRSKYTQRELYGKTQLAQTFLKTANNDPSVEDEFWQAAGSPKTGQ